MRAASRDGSVEAAEAPFSKPSGGGMGRREDRSTGKLALFISIEF
jgi:hypothetical protein